MRMTRFLPFWVLAAIGFLCPPAVRAEGPLSIVVAAGNREREDTPVFLELPADFPIKAPLQLLETTGGKSQSVAAQLESAKPARLWWLLKGKTPANGQRRFTLQSGQSTAGDEITVQAGAQAVEIRKDRKAVLRYNTAHAVPPQGIDVRYGRSAHIHPVWTPTGAVVTDEFPPDHPHQDGIYFAFVKTEFEGRQPDFWNLLGGTGRVRFKELKGTAQGPVFGGLQSVHEHVDLSAPSGKVALIETWDLRVWNIGGGKAGYWVADLTSTVRCAGASPLKLPTYHYGGMAIRGARQWAGDNCTFSTSEGKTRKDGNHSRPRWGDIAGPTAHGSAGVTVMTHPNNFRFPEPLRLHPTMPYMVFTPSQLGDWSIEPGKDLVSRYRYLIHDAKLNVENAERLWHDFAEPPTARVAGGQD